MFCGYGRFPQTLHTKLCIRIIACHPLRVAELTAVSPTSSHFSQFIEKETAV
ncbi:MAG: hypothetical protein GWP17_05330 [Aquificales bacterium]|nr:hypothetical protein [Aquificales bacterium]